MRALIPLFVFIVGCAVLAIGIGLVYPPAGVIAAGVAMIAGPFVWLSVQVVPTARTELDDLREWERRREVA